MIGAFIVFFLVVYALYNDANLLRKENSSIYYQTIGNSPWFWALTSAVLINISFLFVIPTYFFFRNKFFLKLKSDYRRNLIQGYNAPNFVLITECAVIVVLWFFILNLIFVIYSMINFFLPILDGKLYEFVILGLCSHILSVVLIFIFVIRNHREGFFKFLNFRKIKRWFSQGFLLPLGVGLAFAAASYVLSDMEKSQVITPLGGALGDSDYISLILFLFSVMLIAPLVEEIIYRGYLYKVISRVKSKRFSLFFITILFALFHLDQIWGSWYGFATILLMGFSVTLLRYWTNSIIPGIIAHYSYNILLVVLPMLIFFISNPAYAKYYAIGHKLEFAEQEKLLNECIRSRPDNSIAYNDLAWIYAQEDKNLDRALELIEKALFLEGKNPEFLDTKAEILYRLEQLDEAIEIEKSLIDSHPDDVFYQQQLEKFIEARSESAL